MPEQNIAILLVDDSPAMLSIVAKILHQVGYENVDTTRNGYEALEMLEDKNYNLVLSDWNMSPLSGYQLLLRVRATHRAVNLPFIMMTAQASAQNVVDAKSAGVSAYIMKPFTGDALKQKIEGLFKEKPN